MKKYFKVVAKCGHVGRKHYVPIAFAVEAESGKEAARLTRDFPRVKHTQKFAILNCIEISFDEYEELREINSKDEYLKCKNIQMQNQIDMSNRIERDSHYYEVREKIRHIPTLEDKLRRQERIEYKRKREKLQFISRRLVGDF